MSETQATMEAAPVPGELESARLNAEAIRLLGFARKARHRLGGFGWLDESGTLVEDRPVQTWITCRMTHCFALAQLRGDTGDHSEYVDHGVVALRGRLKDARSGGWHSAVDAHGAVGDVKDGYAHAFVVLAAASAAVAGHTDGPALLEEALAVLDARFWDEDQGLIVDVWNRDWTVLDGYRGVNANMHAVEALLAAADATGNPLWLERAVRILRRVVHGFALQHQWRLPEHFDRDWRVRLDYNIDEPGHPFRPYGVTIGHLLEWSRLCLHARTAMGSAAPAWLLADARELYRSAVQIGWAVDGADGFVYTTDFDDNPVVHERMHWVAAEAIAAAWVLHRETGESSYLDDYRRWWRYAEAVFVDRAGGSWWHELDRGNRPSARVWDGKPDVYHAYQTAILPLLPAAGSFIGAARHGW